MPDSTTGDLEPVLGRLLEPAMTGLAARLGGIPDLDPTERTAVLRGARLSLTASIRRKVSRVLLLELNAARLSGRLTAADSAARWDEWIADSSRPGYWESLTDHYPTLLPRLHTVIGHGCDAGLTAARRFAADRTALAELPGAGTGVLTGITFGAGDTHRGGQSVALVTTTTGRTVYKPRPVEVDARLAGLLHVVTADDPPGTRIRVPQVLVRPEYGWAEHVQHRYCTDEAELDAYYRAIGHWLAVMSLLGGSDLHAENVIAVGPVPIVVDCETLFTPRTPGKPSGCGEAADRAAELLADSVLRIGLLPGRGKALGWRGVDLSGVGALPGQQPLVSTPVIADAGTDLAHIDYAMLPITTSDNHPSPEPELGRYWGRVIEGFSDLAARLHRLDRAGQLAEPLAGFAESPIRVVMRATETYQELGRMLWHPVSLHDEPTAVERARGLLAKHAENVASAPGDPTVIEAEIAELLNGDVPVFTTTPGEGTMTGPRGTVFGPARDLITDSLERWRSDDSALDRQVIQGTLVSAYLNEGWLPDRDPMRPGHVSADRLDRRRRDQAAALMGELRDAAIRAQDRTATWIAPVLDLTGWSIQPMASDLYSGLSGTAVLLAAYGFEVAHGRADAVPGLDELLAETLNSLRLAEDRAERDRASGLAIRPDTPGGYVGIGSRIWAWLLLGRLGVPGLHPGQATARARQLALLLPESIEADDVYDLFRGMAGAVVPLLRLAERTHEDAWSALAADIGARLADAAHLDAGTACWRNSLLPEGIGGMAHGATGIGWALARLASVPAVRSAAGTAASAIARTAAAAFAFEEQTYDPELAGWIDLRAPGHTGAAWCHGAVGIGVAAADLLQQDQERWRDVLRRAASSCWKDGRGWNHTLCHGDSGVRDVLDRALALGLAPAGVDLATCDADLLSSLEEFGPISGLARDTFAPGLLPGVGGIAYQLLRMHPDSPLPSLLLPDPGPADPLGEPG